MKISAQNEVKIWEKQILRDVVDPTFYKSFMQDLEQLLVTKEWNVYKWLHQPYPTPEGPSGYDLWANVVEFGHIHQYLLPSLERDLIQNYLPFLNRAFSSMKPFGIMAGAGTRWAVLNKEIPTLKAINACGAADWDLSSQMAYDATDLIREKLRIKSVPLVKDFSEPLIQLLELAGSSPVFVTMFGCTLGNDINLEHVPQNFAKVLNRKGFFWLTIDSSSHEAAVAGYQSSPYTSFQNNYWTFAKHMTEDENFDETAIRYHPYYTEAINDDSSRNHYKAVIHRHVVVRDTVIRIGNKSYTLEKDMEFKIGQSQKWKPEDIRKPFADAGWDQLAVMQQGNVAAVLYAGQDTPKDWLLPVVKALESKA